jgi:hypothetical protein
MSNFKFKKGTFNRALLFTPEGKKRSKVKYEETKGCLSPNFGINFKHPELQWYSVTHLKTGYAVTHFDSMKDAKEFVQEVEKVKDIEKMNMDNAIEYADEVREITNRIRYRK